MTSKLVTEVIGTFFLVLTIGLTVTAGLPLAPLVIGAVLMAMVYMGGHISGAQYNPAVTLAILLRGKISPAQAGAYVVAQLGGAVLGALAVYAMTGAAFAPAPGPDEAPMAVLLAEALFTFALALVVLNVATTRATEGNSYFGLAIGFTVMVGAFAVGGISGGAFNPAVGIGPAIVSTLLGEGGLDAAWYYIVGPLAGAALAAWVFRVQNSHEFIPAVAVPSGDLQPEGKRVVRPTGSDRPK
jgi:aquaporin Z